MRGLWLRTAPTSIRAHIGTKKFSFFVLPLFQPLPLTYWGAQVVDKNVFVNFYFFEFRACMVGGGFAIRPQECEIVKLMKLIEPKALACFQSLAWGINFINFMLKLIKLITRIYVQCG